MGRPAVVVAVGEVGPGVGEVGMVEVGGDGVGDGDLGLFHIRLCIAWRFYLLLGREDVLQSTGELATSYFFA